MPSSWSTTSSTVRQNQMTITAPPAAQYNELRRLENAYKENPQLVNKWMKLEVESAQALTITKSIRRFEPFYGYWWVAGKF